MLKNNSINSKNKSSDKIPSKDNNPSAKILNNIFLPKKLKKPIISKNNVQYELFNTLSENGDSIYSSYAENVILEGKEQIFISLSEIKKIVNENLFEGLNIELVIVIN